MTALASTLPAEDSPVRRPQAARDLRPLRFITCGSVDDGKSTLIGRLLWDTKMVPDDQAESVRNKSAGQETDLALPDFANLLDGLQAEREQGITIDVAYRYFSTEKRSFIVADTPGHEQYTRNMATGASTADLAVLLVDARAGILEQTRRHGTIVALMGITQIVLAVNKFDLVQYSQTRFDEICGEFEEIARSLNIGLTTVIPTSAVNGENVAFAASDTMPWYEGPTLLEALERAPKPSGQSVGFRFPVQRVTRPDETFRGYQGTIAGGAVKPGDGVVILPSGETANVSKIVTFDLVRNAGVTGDAVTLVLDRPIDIARGDVIASVDSRPETGSAFSAHLIVLDSIGLKNEHRYWLKSGSRRQMVTVTAQKTLDLNSQTWIPGSELAVNQIAEVRLEFDEVAIFDPYRANHDTGSFILVDTDTNNTAAAGMILKPADNVVPIKTRDEQAMTAIIVPSKLVDELRRKSPLSEHAEEISYVGLNPATLQMLVEQPKDCNDKK